MNQLSNENNAHMIFLQAFKNEAVYSNHVKDYGLIAKTFAESKFGHLFVMSWTQYIAINGIGIRDPTLSQLKKILSDIQVDVYKKLSILSQQANEKHYAASNCSKVKGFLCTLRLFQHSYLISL